MVVLKAFITIHRFLNSVTIYRYICQCSYKLTSLVSFFFDIPKPLSQSHTNDIITDAFFVANLHALRGLAVSHPGYLPDCLVDIHAVFC